MPDAWFGYTAEVAAGHYQWVTDEDYAAATGDPVGPRVGPSQGQPQPPRSIKAQKNPGHTGVLMAADGAGWADEDTRSNGLREDSLYEPEYYRHDGSAVTRFLSASTAVWRPPPLIYHGQLQRVRTATTVPFGVSLCKGKQAW